MDEYKFQSPICKMCSGNTMYHYYFGILCRVCGHTDPTVSFYFCPNCGIVSRTGGICGNCQTTKQWRDGKKDAV